MKTEWTFHWEARDFHFAKEHHFTGTLREDSSGQSDPSDHMKVHALVVPDDHDPYDREVEQTGELRITIPLRPEDAEGLAYVAAQQMCEQVAFRNGDFRLDFSLVTCKRIAENPEEEAEIDGKIYSMRISFQEVVATPEFDGTAFKGISSSSPPIELLSQFNETRRDTSPIRKFLGYFRILESLSQGQADRVHLKKALLGYASLAHHFAALVPNGDFATFIGELVETRHRCAHLKVNVGFGYAPTDPAIAREVTPQLPLLEALVYRCLDER
jgi:hypothetical protein